MKVKWSLLLLLIVVPLVFFASKYSAKLLLSSAPEGEKLMVNLCQFGIEKCAILYRDQMISVFTENALTTNGPIQFVLQLPEAVANDFASVTLKLEGKTMYMGLVETSLKQQGRVWYGDLYMPFCTTEKMDWVLAINLVDQSNKHYQAEFEFQVSHN